MLVVEDDEANRWLLSALLKEEGYEVETAADVPEALVQIQRPSSYEAVLLDVQLAERSGLELIPPIREHCAQTKIMLLSGRFDLEALRPRVDAVFPKGGSFSEFLGTLAKMVSR
ncbi:MAG TPA: response regulator [Polyangia bacterium]|nr:response regulator [Polyangia bacterium]